MYTTGLDRIPSAENKEVNEKSLNFTDKQTMDNR